MGLKQDLCKDEVTNGLGLLQQEAISFVYYKDNTCKIKCSRKGVRLET